MLSRDRSRWLQFDRDLLRDRAEALPPRCVLVVDEAGMVSTRSLSKLVDGVEGVGGKLVLVGDHRQLPEIEAGGAFRGLVNRGLAIPLSENRRQIHAWERTALDHLRDGRPTQALSLYEAHDRIRIDDTSDRSRERLVEDWWRAGDPQRAVMIAQRRVDVEDLSARARERMRDAGLLGHRELSLPGGRFAAGDHVVVKLNDLPRGIANGDRARVTAVDPDPDPDPDSGRLALDCRGEPVVLDADYLYGRTAHGDPTLRHGYAITTHVAQGLTVDRAMTSRLADAERSYAQAADRRRTLEATRTRWLPGRRRQLADLDRAEVAAARLVRDLRRLQLELGHGARPFLTEREHDPSFAKTADLLAERRLQRAHHRGHDRGLEL